MIPNTLRWVLSKIRRKREKKIKEQPPSDESRLFLSSFQWPPSLSTHPWPHWNKSHCLRHLIPGNWPRIVWGETLWRMPAAYKVVSKGSLPMRLCSTGRGVNIHSSDIPVCCWVRFAPSWRVHTASFVCFSVKDEIYHEPSMTAAQPWVAE